MTAKSKGETYCRRDSVCRSSRMRCACQPVTAERMGAREQGAEVGSRREVDGLFEFSDRCRELAFLLQR